MTRDTETIELKWAWTWSGQCFGYWDGDDLWAYHGRHVGHRTGSDIFGPTGRYLGEVMHNDRLITNKAKAAHTNGLFTPSSVRQAQQIQLNGAAHALYKGYQDFPHPDLF
jgi:hypothetical protein